MLNNQQFSCSYLPPEDRLLVRGRFGDGTEVSLLLTRRLTRGLLETIERLSGALVPKDIGDPSKLKMVAEFTRQAAVEKADFSQTYAAGEPHPFMQGGPRLVIGISFAPQKNNVVAVTVRLDKKDQITFAMPANGLWSLSHLIAKQADAAGWDLPKSAAPAPAAARIN